MVIDDTPAKKFGLKMENVVPIRIRGKQIGLGFAIFSAWVILPNVTIPIAAQLWVPACIAGYQSKIMMAIATVKHIARQANKHDINVRGLTVVFDSWYFAVALCQVIRFYQMHFITHSTSNRYFRLPDAAGKPGTRIQARELIDSNRIGQMKRCDHLRVRYANMGRLNLPRYGWVFATVVYNPKCYPQKFLLVTNNLAANGPSVIEKYQKRWGVEVMIRAAKQDVGLEQFHMPHFSGICAHVALMMFDYLLRSWIRYHYHLRASMGQLVHRLFHECMVQSVGKAHDSSHQQTDDALKWLPLAA